MLTSNEVTLTLPRPHPGQQRVKEGLRRFNVLNMGRRWGKTTFGLDYISDDVLNGHPIGWFTPTYKLMLESWRDMLQVFGPVVRRKNATERRIELVTGGVVEFWPVDTSDVARSRHYKKVVVDEAAMIPHLKDAWEHGIRPTLTDLRGDALFASTPKGMNYFHELYTRGVDKDNTDWAAWTEPTSNNPYISDEEIEAARQELPARVFEQEYLATFLAHAGAVFRNIEASMVAEPQDPSDHKGHRIGLAVDWGKHKDFTALACGCLDCRIELARDRFNKIDYTFQRSRIESMYNDWNATWVFPERNSMGEPIIEQLIDDGMQVWVGPDDKPGFMTTATSKPQLIENFSLVLERSEWRFQADPLWTAELEAYERTVSRTTGRSSYSAPEGMHDDTVIARALLVWMANEGVVRWEGAGAEKVDDYESRWT